MFKVRTGLEPTEIGKRKQDECLSQLIDIEDQIALQQSIMQNLRRPDSPVSRPEAYRTRTSSSYTVCTAYKRRKAGERCAAGERWTGAGSSHNGGKVDASVHVSTCWHSQSKAAQDWECQKRDFYADNKHTNAIMNLIGLELVEEQVLWVKDKVDIVLRQGVRLSHERFNALFLCNSGTGLPSSRSCWQY